MGDTVTHAAGLRVRHVIVTLEGLAQDGVVRLLGDAGAAAGVEGGEVPAHAVNQALARRLLVTNTAQQSVTSSQRVTYVENDQCGRESDLNIPSDLR